VDLLQILVDQVHVILIEHNIDETEELYLFIGVD
jgi:hypothetical protein